MVFRDKIIKIKEAIKVPDGMGGFISEEPTQTLLNCRASLNTSPEVATAYGTNGEQVLYVVSRERLDEEAFYLYLEKRYTVRAQTDNNRLYYSTLIEVKQ